MSKDEERSGAAGAAEDASSLRAVDTRAMPQGGRARLVEIMGGHPGKAHYLDADGTLIGRDDEVDIRLPGTEVSRRHARIWCGEADVWQVEDLGSRNGILINGLPAAQSKLCFGDQLQFGGQTLFIFTQHEQLEDLVSNVQRMETLGILAGGVAHDFNNLLSVLVTNIDFLQEHHGPRPLDEATLQECLSEMRVATEEAETLIRRLLRYARPSQGVVVEDVNCTALVTDITGLCRRTFGPTITWAVTNDGEAWVRGDRGELGQIIMNLLINARDAMPRGGKIGVHIHQDRLHADLVASGGTHSGEYIRLDISDTGVGMAPGTRDHIFEPFFTTKGAQKGTGMGLATVQALVHGHGGQVRVESVEGQGTTFSV
ncbi:MAG: FHA domain-containing protein, partial [Deltaproteobacteria bacterium]|nr:FHA domain-containing protein [Deltaproteobacteria bacterium]